MNHANVFSRQIRPPIYTMKQSKLRKRRVWRFAIMYFTLFVVFLALAIAPVLGGSKVPVDSLKKIGGGGDSMVSLLFQPNIRSSSYYNDTGPTLTEIKSSEASVTNKAKSTATESAKETDSGNSNNRRSVKLL